MYEGLYDNYSQAPSKSYLTSRLAKLSVKLPTLRLSFKTNSSSEKKKGGAAIIYFVNKILSYSKENLVIKFGTRFGLLDCGVTLFAFICQTTERHVLEDCLLNIYRLEDIKFHTFKTLTFV